jgi:hypothetical protein
MQFRAAPPPQVRSEGPLRGPLRVTVSDRWILLVTAAYGTPVARPARTTMLARDATALQPRLESEARLRRPPASLASRECGAAGRESNVLRDRGNSHQALRSMYGLFFAVFEYGMKEDGATLHRDRCNEAVFGL